MDSKQLTAKEVAEMHGRHNQMTTYIETALPPYYRQFLDCDGSHADRGKLLADRAALEQRVADQRKCIGELTRTGVSLLNQRDALQREVERMKEAAAKALADGDSG